MCHLLSLAAVILAVAPAAAGPNVVVILTDDKD